MKQWWYSGYAIFPTALLYSWREPNKGYKEVVHDEKDNALGQYEAWSGTHRHTAALLYKPSIEVSHCPNRLLKSLLSISIGQLKELRLLYESTLSRADTDLPSLQPTYLEGHDWVMKVKRRCVADSQVFELRSLRKLSGSRVLDVSWHDFRRETSPTR
jgi:hypothetical protein